VQYQFHVDRLPSFVTDESGVTAIEYALIAGLISVVIIGAVATVGTTINVLFFTAVAGALGGAP
jgi:pilus assembly protein Flp/PilA